MSVQGKAMSPEAIHALVEHGRPSDVIDGLRVGDAALARILQEHAEWIQRHETEAPSLDDRRRG